jgi:DNA polymerase
MVIHGREHLLEQLSVIDPKIVVLLGNTACLALLGGRGQRTREHGRIFRKEGRTYLITVHPAYAMRFPEGKKQFVRDFAKLKKLMRDA